MGFRHRILRILIAVAAAGCAAPSLAATPGFQPDPALVLMRGDVPLGTSARDADPLSETAGWQDFVDRLTDPYAEVPVPREAGWEGLAASDLLRAVAGSGASSARDPAQEREARWRGIMNTIIAHIPEPDRGSMLLTGVLGAWFIARRRWRNGNQTGRF